MVTRLDRAKQIVEYGGVHEHLPDYRVFEVRSDTGNIHYVKVYPDGRMECDCKDYAPFCKHKLSIMESMNQKRVR